jgi:hypothetical protein
MSERETCQRQDVNNWRERKRVYNGRRNHSRDTDLVHFVDAFRRWAPSNFSTVRVTVDEYAEEAGRDHRSFPAECFTSHNVDCRGDGLDSLRGRLRRRLVDSFAPSSDERKRVNHSGNDVAESRDERVATAGNAECVGACQPFWKRVASWPGRSGCGQPTERDLRANFRKPIRLWFRCRLAIRLRSLTLKSNGT